MGKVAIYTRVSTTEQAREGYSLEAQQHTLSNWVVSQGHEIYKIYEDAGLSGRNTRHRPAFQAMISDAQQRKFDILAVWALSRLTRSVADLYATCAILERYNISLKSHTEAIDTGTSTGRALMGMIGIFAQMESEITGERVRHAMSERARQGKRTANKVLGYDPDGADTLKINEREAVIVRYIFDKYIEYNNLSAVAELCDLKGYRGKQGRVFKAEHIKVILTRPLYIGYNSFMGELYKGTHPPIIPEAQFYRVQRILRKKAKNRRSLQNNG